MGNCQAIDTATAVIQHPNGKVDKMYWPISTSEVMKMNPGFYVTLLITTTTISQTKTTDMKNQKNVTDSKNTVRITRVKLLRSTDTLTLGHVYRLISTQEVMKGLVAKKQAKTRKNGIEFADSEGLKEAENFVKKSLQDNKTQQVSRKEHRSRTRAKSWQPSLNSISEFTS